MKEIDLTWKIALRIWWSYTWRCIAIILPCTFVIGGIAGFAIGTSGGNVEDYGVWLQLTGGLIGCLLSFIILRDTLAKRYKRFRLVVVENEPEEIVIDS